MFRNNLSIAVRSLAKNRLSAFLNITGLAVGVTATVLLALYAWYEWSFDRFHQHADRIVRVVFRAEMNGGVIKEPFAMPPVAATLKNDYPEVEEAGRLRVAGTQTLVQGEHFFRGVQMAFADTALFHIFTFPLVYGATGKYFLPPHTVVLSETLAKRLFGAGDPVGKVVRVKDWPEPLQVVAVMRDIPRNAHFQFDLFCSMANARDAVSDSWMQSEFYTYLLLKNGTNPQQLESKLPTTLEKYMGPQLLTGLGMTLAALKSKGDHLGLFLQPLTDIHLHSDFNFDLRPAGDMRYVLLFATVAVFILFIACINFVNLSTASASGRAREVGIRKAIGSTRSGLMRQFLTESLLTTGIAFALALLLVVSMLPHFSRFTEQQFDPAFLKNPALWWAFAGLWWVVGLLAGLYPAFFMSGFKPVVALKQAIAGVGAAGGHLRLRSALVVVQFAISVTLMIATLTVYEQLRYIQNKSVGYDRSGVIVLENTGLLGDKEAAFRAQIAQHKDVLHVSNSAFKPVGPSWNNNSMMFPDERSAEMMRLLRYDVDPDYLPTLGMKIAKGRNFMPAFPADSAHVLINQTAAKSFGWSDEEALGHTLQWSNRGGAHNRFQVIGVVEDFHFKSLHEPVTPLVMVLGRTPGLIVRTRDGQAAAVQAFAMAQWAQFSQEPLETAFLDDYYQQTYRAERKTGWVMGLFSALTILIACLGLFGLASFMVVQRTREIGIRKTLGATITGIVGLLTKDFLKLVLLAILLAAPCALYLLRKWLSSFAYHIEMQWWMFVAAGVAALLVAFFTVGFQSVKAAWQNPVKSLRSE